MRIRVVEEDTIQDKVIVYEVFRVSYDYDEKMLMCETSNPKVDLGVYVSSVDFSEISDRLFEKGFADLTQYGYVTYFDVAE